MSLFDGIDDDGVVDFDVDIFVPDWERGISINMMVAYLDRTFDRFATAFVDLDRKIRNTLIEKSREQRRLTSVSVLPTIHV